GFVERSQAVTRLLHDRRTTFVVVTTLEAAPLHEAEFFVDVLQDKKLHLGALVLNKVLPDYLLSPDGDHAASVLERESETLAETLAADAVPGLDDVAPTARVLRTLGDSFRNYEVVARREAHGSYLKRHPHIAKGQLFPQLIVELYLKTKDKTWKGKPLVADDPLMDYRDGDTQIRLLNPAKPIHGQEPFLVLPTADVFARPDEWTIFPEMRKIVRQTFLVLEKAWQLEGGTLVDLKVEFGHDPKGRLLLADVIDNDSWRVVEDGSYIDKQVYREGGALDDVAAKYRRVADITSRFRLPRQQILLWRGSESDRTDAFSHALGELADLMTIVTCSIHKEPVRGASVLHRMIQEVPDTVVIANIGRSNGAGPVLSAMSTVPVITVPASAKDFPEDVWSSLRAPSNVPVMTVLEPANAVLAALQILSARNPRIYARVRGEIESRTVNTIPL
ncbi:MAG: phosphoribosylaminoimidazolesuccinocarboxamide synthase, partial [Xanthobacteraceae bacterium]